MSAQSAAVSCRRSRRRDREERVVSFREGCVGSVTSENGSSLYSSSSGHELLPIRCVVVLLTVLYCNVRSDEKA